MANLDDDLPLTANYKQLSVRHYQLELQCDLASRVFRGRALLSVTPGPEWAEHADPASLVLDCSDIAVEEVSLLRGHALGDGDEGKPEPVKSVLPYVASHMSCLPENQHLGTHPHKKGPVMEIYARHLTSFSMVIYQAEHNLWCPGNVGWGNFAYLEKFQVKYGKNGKKMAKNE